MKTGGENTLLVVLLCSALLYQGFGVNSLSYDYTSSSECLTKPQKPQYGGGIIINPEFEDGLTGWSNFGNARIQHRESKGNKFIVIHSRNQPSDSTSQKFYLQKDLIYTFSAWIRVSRGNGVAVTASFNTSSGVKYGGSIVVKSHCWSFLKGGLAVDDSGPAQLLFESKDTSAEIWVDSVSLQPFTQKQWKSHQDQSIHKVRKSVVRFQVTNAKNSLLKSTKVSIKQTKPNFPFGCGMNYNILTNTAYQNWFASRFKATTFTNDLKWYSTEPSQGNENYTIPDAMLKFAQANKISVRGHNVFWDKVRYQPRWVSNLGPEQLRAATERRINSVVSRYKGNLIAWDVVNENIHFSFFEDILGKDFSAETYYKAQQIDPTTTMFLNEYNTIEYSGDAQADPLSYKNKVEEILSFPRKSGNLSIGIGVQGNFGPNQPNLAYMRSALDTLATVNVPIWLTELNVKRSPNQAQYLEEVLREGYSHPGVQGIIMFAGPISAGFNVLTLADENFKNTPSGDVVDKLIGEWKSANSDLQIITDDKGFVEMSLFHGDYEIYLKYPETNSYVTRSFRVTQDKKRSIVNVPI